MVSSAALFLTGCGFTASKPTVTAVEAHGIHGKLYGGQNPVVGASVQVWEIGSTGYGSAATPLGTAVNSLSDGSFTYGSYTCPPVAITGGFTEDAYLYITATGGDSGGGNNSSLMLAAGIGDCTAAANEVVEINEVSTVVLAYAMSAYFSGGEVNNFGAPDTANGYQGMITANAVTIPLLTNVADGTVNVNGTANGTTVVIESAKIYSLANTLAACVNSADDTSGSTPAPSSACSTLFADTVSTTSGLTPADTLAAAVYIATGPYQNVQALYQLGAKDAPFTGLTSAPNDWTVGVSYQTPSMGLSIAAGTTSNLDIDEYGRVWFPSNATKAAGLGYFDPGVVQFGGPFNANDGVGDVLMSPQYVAVDGVNDLAWATDLGSSYVGSVSTFPLGTGTYAYGFIAETSDTPALTGTSGPIAINFDSTLDFAFTDSAAVIHLEEAAGSSLTPFGTFTHVPTGFALDINSTLGAPEVDAATSDSSGCYLEQVGGSSSTDVITVSALSGTCVSGGAAQNGATSNILPFFLVNDSVGIASTADEFCDVAESNCFTPTVGLTLPQGVAYDANGNLWIANSGNASVSTLSGVAYAPPFGAYLPTSSVPYLHDANNGGTMTIPYGIGVDGSGNVWVSNATCVAGGTTPCTTPEFTLSELIGAAAGTVTPIASQSLGINFAGSLAKGTARANRVPSHIVRR